jgi:hypothetical protein
MYSEVAFHKLPQSLLKDTRLFELSEGVSEDSSHFTHSAIGLAAFD